ncbi:MAG TPA: sodium-dependent transporter [Alcanivoracaceae bacterium]|nr:sodium-dependent transporter [Alcanivoracaceae bacterium]
MSKDTAPHGAWTSRWAFILAATGSAVGLGNIWRFPYMAGENGGGAFVLVYLVCVLLIGIPIMMAEVAIGRRGGLSPVNAIRKIARDTGVSRRWSGVGYLGALTGFLILSFYSVIGGWALYYIGVMASGSLANASEEVVLTTFTDMLANPGLMLACQTVFLVTTMFFIARGVNKGLELAVRIMMPLLFVLLVLLAGYGVTRPGFAEAMHFMFVFNWDNFTGQSVLAAMGQAFFSLSLGMGAIMAYGAYMPKTVKHRKTGKLVPVSIASTVFVVAFLDVLTSLLSGVAIFPLVFTNGLDAASGPGLLFENLPLAFSTLSFGTIVGAMFFLFVLFAGLTSSISIGEPAVAWLVEKGNNRIKSAVIIGGLTWLLGIGSLLSFNLWDGFNLLPGRSFFESMDFITSNIMLPLGGLLIAIFAGWIMKETHIRKELAMKNFGLYLGWRAVLRILVPLTMLLIFWHKMVG